MINNKTLIFYIILFLPSLCSAENPKSDSDFRSLPPFCKARVSGGNSTIYKTWHKRLGEDFIHVHHYCSGLYTLNLARRTTNKRQRTRLLNTVISEAGYVEKHANKNFKLFPYIYTTIGETYSLLNNNPKAARYLNKAISRKNNLTRAYIKLADIYEKLGQKDMAIETIQNGLKHKPKSKSLNRRLKKYGVKK